MHHPPCKSQINISSLLSYSISSDHSITVTEGNSAFAFGSNEGFRIIPTLPEENTSQPSEILIQDKNGNLFNFISAVCGEFYTLYLISSNNQPINQLAYANRNFTQNSPFFLNLNGHVPQYLFGGQKVSAAIDTDGLLFIIKESIFTSPNKTVKPSILPNSSKAICVACCNSFIVVLCSNGLCFLSSLEFDKISFTLIEDFESEEIIEISGTCDHCFAVCKSGKVFGYGSNFVGCLGIGNDLIKTKKFTEIKTLEKYKIVHASAGCNHSLFVTSEGKVIACGSNYYGQLLLNKELNNEIFKIPVETTITKGATFSIAGNCLSAVFVDCQPPKNTPNQVIKTIKNKKIKNEIKVDKGQLIEQLKKQNVRLLDQLNKSMNDSFDLHNQISKLENEIKQYQKSEMNSKKEFNQIKEKLNNFKNLIEQNNSLKKELNELKEQIGQPEENNQYFKNKIDELKNQIDLKQKENSSLNEEKNNLLAQINQKEEEKNSLKEEINNLKHQIDLKQNENESILNKFNKLKNEANAKEEENKELKQDQINLKSQINKKEKENESLKEELFKLKQKINQKKTKVTTIQVLDIPFIDSLENVKKLGRGATSEVYKVFKREFYALKIFDLELCKKETEAENNNNNDNDDDDDEEIEIDIDKMKRFINEYEVLSQLDHPNIIKTYGFCFGDKKHPPSILLELCQSNLKKKIKTLQDLDRITIILEIASAMKAIHKAGIFHRDLKLENILIDSENHVKLCDFGLCTLIENDSESLSRSQLTGTLSYMAPEIIQGKKNYTEKVDVYSFGVVLFIILTKGEYPNIGLLEVGSGKMAEIPEIVTSFSKELIQKCWSFDASNRPSFEEIFRILNDNKDKII